MHIQFIHVFPSSTKDGGPEGVLHFVHSAANEPPDCKKYILELLYIPKNILGMYTQMQMLSIGVLIWMLACILVQLELDLSFRVKPTELCLFLCYNICNSD